jgi:predicted NodU family carbamoyl transferase
VEGGSYAVHSQFGTALRHRWRVALFFLGAQALVDYHRLIQYFGQASGVPVLLNTSFNLKGEPIVESPADAFCTFSKSEMDCLVLENFVVEELSS